MAKGKSVCRENRSRFTAFQIVTLDEHYTLNVSISCEFSCIIYVGAVTTVVNDKRMKTGNFVS